MYTIQGIQVDASAFEGAQLPVATFNLLDDKFNSLDTNGQPWTVTIRVREVSQKTWEDLDDRGRTS